MSVAAVVYPPIVEADVVKDWQVYELRNRVAKERYYLAPVCPVCGLLSDSTRSHGHVVQHDDHASLTEPVVRAHVRERHGWSVPDCYGRTYFQVLVKHEREHRKADMAVSP